MNKLVIGGSGFVGSVLVEKLLERGFGVIVFDNLRFGYSKNIEHLPVEFIKGDVLNPKVLEDYMDQVDVVYYLATVNIIAAENDYSDCITNNVTGVNNILEIVSKYKNIKRFVYTSTSSIYGNGLDITEDSKREFLNIYAATKYSSECLCRLYESRENLPLTIIRYTNTYGKNQRPESPYCGVVSRFVNKAVLGEDIQINGDGKQYRDFMYVDDVANLTIDLSLMKESIGQDVNFNTNNSVTILEVAELVKKLTNSNSKIVTIPERKIDSIKYRKLKNDKLLSLIDIDFIDIESGLSKTIEWYKENYANEI
jgi:UDP-glucose 4-epimerase